MVKIVYFSINLQEFGDKNEASLVAYLPDRYSCSWLFSKHYARFWHCSYRRRMVWDHVADLPQPMYSANERSGCTCHKSSWYGMVSRTVLSMASSF